MRLSAEVDLEEVKRQFNEMRREALEIIRAVATIPKPRSTSYTSSPFTLEEIETARAFIKKYGKGVV